MAKYLTKCLFTLRQIFSVQIWWNILIWMWQFFLLIVGLIFSITLQRKNGHPLEFMLLISCPESLLLHKTTTLWRSRTDPCRITSHRYCTLHLYKKNILLTKCSDCFPTPCRCMLSWSRWYLGNASSLLNSPSLFLPVLLVMFVLVSILNVKYMVPQWLFRMVFVSLWVTPLSRWD